VTSTRPIAGLLVLLLAVAGAADVPARAEDDPAAVRERLRALEGRIEDDRSRAAQLAATAAEQARQLDALRAEMQAAARAVQSHEGAITRLEREQEDLHTEIVAKRASLADRRAQLGATLGALQRIALRPPAALLVAPGDPNDIVRTGLLIRTAIPQIESRAASLRQDLDELAALDAQLDDNRRDLVAAGEALKVERDRLAAVVERKNTLFEATRAEQDAAVARIEQLTRQSHTLGDLLKTLMQRGEMHDAAPLPRPRSPAAATVGAAPEGARAAAAPPLSRQSASPPAGAAVSEAHGRLTPPARGELIVAFGDRNAFGATARGVTWRVRPAASVLAPWDGRVVFGGPFRHFGRILIIDHGEGYHSLIAGLARIDARAGQWVLAGEPVGAAGETGTANGATAGGGTASGNGGGAPTNGPGERAEGPTVYVEFRRNGQPINPLPWLAASLDRTNG
jgi:septal ring factor EnvC (AmiA/AmiB activator)